MACPICARPATDRYRPFCSRRCADVDLGKWLGGAYRVPSQRVEDAEEALDELDRRMAAGDGPENP